MFATGSAPMVSSQNFAWSSRQIHGAAIRKAKHTHTAKTFGPRGTIPAAVTSG